MTHLYTIDETPSGYVIKTPMGMTCAWYGRDFEAALDDEFARNRTRVLRIMEAERKKLKPPCVTPGHCPPKHCGPDEGA